MRFDTPWVNHFYLVPTVVILVCLTGFLLSRIGRGDQVIKGIIILVLHCLIVILRSQEVFDFINALFPLNHVGWFILILIVFISFCLTLDLMRKAGATFPYRHVNYINIIYLITLSFIFYFVSKTPANTNGRLVYTVSQGLFMAVYYIYAVYMSFGLFKMTRYLQKQKQAQHQKYRWVAIGSVFILYLIYNFLALVNIGFVYTVGNKQQFITTLNGLVLIMTTFAVIPVFAPGFIYKTMDSITDFIRRLIYLYHLIKITNALKKENYCEVESQQPDKGLLDQLNLNFHIHCHLMFVQDYKYHSAYLARNTQDENISNKFPITHSVIHADDSKTGLDLINEYAKCLP